MNRDDVVTGYMMNDKKVIAEMLYDTITKYEMQLEELRKQLSSNSLQLKEENEKLHNAWVDCVERYESVLNKQIIKENHTCEGCKYGKFGADSIGIELECYLSWDCSRGRIDKWESKE